MSGNHHKLTRILRLYAHLPRAPQQALSLYELMTQLLGLYSNDKKTEDASILKAIRRDIDALQTVLATGTVENLGVGGNQPNLFRLSTDACIEPMSKESALVMTMAQQLLKPYLPYQVLDKC